MPLLKSAAQPVAAVAVVNVPETHEERNVKPVAKRELQPASLDAKSRQIQRQGAYQAALQSVGVVQHGGKTFSDYLARVREAAESELVFINE